LTVSGSKSRHPCWLLNALEVFSRRTVQPRRHGITLVIQTDVLSGDVYTAAPRHHAIVRLTHWLTALSSTALLVTGIEIVISHPRFYWGESGNVLTTPLFSLPIPSSRSMVPTGYGYVLPDQNGWSRSLHFEAAWLLVLTGLVYVVFGLYSRHFRKHLALEASDRRFFRTIADHLRLRRPPALDAWSYNPVQRLAYLVVIFGLFPLVVWTGLAMSPAFTSAVPVTVTAFGGRQTARTVHFFVSLSLVVFIVIHIAMVWLAGFRNRLTAMITGRVREEAE